MTWAENHAESEHLASDAEIASRSGDTVRAERLYKAAASAELRALEELDSSKHRTLGITAVSAVALLYKAQEFDTAQDVAYRWLRESNLPRFAVSQLQGILSKIWAREEQDRAGLKFVRGGLLVGVSGSQIVRGGAPLDLILQKIDQVQALYFRAAELILNRPARRRGPPSSDIQALFRLWLFQTPPGSYQFEVLVQEPPQGELFDENRPRVAEVTEKCLQIVQAAVSDSEVALREAVPDKDYRQAFLKLARNLAPTGKTFEKLEVRDASRPESRPVSLVPESRALAKRALRLEQPLESNGPASGDAEERLTGTLRALDLDDDWLEITVDERVDVHLRVRGVGEALDDVIGSMVNRRVIVYIIRNDTGYRLRDIELEE
jgi:hypothetical protein